VSFRPLAFVSGLTLGDFILWHWSLNANHDVLALVSGLTLPPIALVGLWLLALNILRLLGRSARRSGHGTIPRSSRGAGAAADAARQSATAGDPQSTPASASSSAPSSGKLAA
jgi:hypothetical protein